jgi:hypothetical protein
MFRAVDSLGTPQGGGENATAKQAKNTGNERINNNFKMI